jgi:hypothetical protein
MVFVFLLKINMTDFIQINKFSSLHNGKDIIFCKTDYILEEFKNIEKSKNDIILITGNSDYSIDDRVFNLKPNNIVKWYAQNALVNHHILEPLPLGLENKNPSLRDGHGIGYYDRVSEKETLLSRNLNISPNKKIYSNFNINTNYHYRKTIKDVCYNSPHITWEDSNLTLTEFFNNILNYESVICPIGNGIDTHRLWEVLYSNRIPITIKVGDYKIYELYKKLPIIILNNIEELYDIETISYKINEIKSKKYDLEILDFNFWKNKILNDVF